MPMLASEISKPLIKSFIATQTMLYIQNLIKQPAFI